MEVAVGIGRAAAAPLAAVLLVTAAPASWPQEAAPQDAGPDYEGCRYADAAGTQEATAGAQVTCQIERWRRHDPVGRTLAGDPSVVLVDGSETLGLDVSHRNWGASRALAYARAWLRAMGAFVGLRRQQIETETARTYFDPGDDPSRLFREDPRSYLERIEEKKAVLVEGQLDQALKDEIGLSDEQIERLSAPEKITTFREEFERRSMTRAVGGAAGLIPVRTFEAIDAQGSSAIGVVVVYSERMAQVAAAIADGRRIAADPRRARYAVEEWIDELSDEDLTSQFGVRLWWDEWGYPVVVSFGQWGVALTNSSSRAQDRARRAAAIQAEQDARSGLAEFVNVATSFSTETIRREIVEASTSLHADGVAEDAEIADVVGEVREEAKTRSAAEFTGLGILRTWSARHPIAVDQELVGAVAYWSPAREDLVRTGLGMGPRHADPEPAPVSSGQADTDTDTTTTPTGRVQSKPLMDAADF